MNTYSYHPCRRVRVRAFTLVEVMISVAIVLILIVGVSQVFKISSESAGTNAALGAIARDHRAAQATMSEDFRNCVPNSPFFLIDSEIAYKGPSAPQDGGMQNKRGFNAGWKSVTEQSLATNPDPTFKEINGVSTSIPIASTDDRAPRIDRTAWFARSVYQRGTADNNALMSGMTSSEAFIWYGHTCLPSTQTPVGANAPYGTWMLPENQYAADRILGRVTLLLKDGTAMSNADLNTSYARVNGTPPLYPIDAAKSGQAQTLLDSRWDVAQATIAQYGLLIDAGVQSNPGNWWRRITDQSNYDPTAGAFPENWFFRFTCNPKFSRPITAGSMAVAAPYFVGHCTQFIVEYAGDYLNQDDTGAITGAGQVIDPNTPGTIVQGTTDGKIDFVVSANGQRRIRWYGLYRDADGDGVIGLNDVVPLADVLAAANIRVSGNPAQAPWEKVLPIQSGTDQMGLRASDAPRFKYVCAWHNDAPPLIRVLVKINDPGNRLQDGQWYEYVLTR